MGELNKYGYDGAEDTPAFPVPASDARNVFDDMAGNAHAPGMSLRDWFAGQALVGILSGDCSPRPEGSDIGGTDPDLLESRARFAYQQADAMIEARQEDLS